MATTAIMESRKRLGINLDTGAGYGAQLTACDLLTRQIWQAGAEAD